ncbi:MAG: sensor histidine kinase [Chitinophagaceae bacterium]|nr:sensor histidine kinase [Chitinophagaceae bacterium]
MKRPFILVVQFLMLLQIEAQEGRKLNKSQEQKLTDTPVDIRKMIVNAIEVGKHDSSSADKIFRRAIEKAKRANDLHGTGEAYYEMGEMYYRYKNHNKSFGAFFNAKEYFVKADSKNEIATTNFTLGRQQFYRGNYKIAAGHLNFAMREAKKLHLQKLEADVLEYMGILYHVMPNPVSKSSDLLRKSLYIKQKINDQSGAFHIGETLAEVYYDEKNFDSALYFSRSSVLLAEKLGLNYEANLARLHQIRYLLRLNKQEDAKGMLYSIKEKVFDSSDLNISIRYYTQSGNYHTAVQDTIAGRKMYDSAMQIAQNSGFPEMYSLVYKNMADAYYCAGDFRKAFEYQFQYTAKMANLYSADNYATFGELEYILKTNMTEGEVKHLSVENEIKELRLKNERTLRVILLISTAGFLLSAAIIFILYKKQKRKSSIIEKQGNELQTLMKEIHHRVKNNLQVISSLLDLQSQTIGDKQAAEAIKESRNRVQTMALIHQDLYSEGNIKGVEMPDYINKLVLSLFSSYNVKKNKIQLETNIEPILLDIDLVIPIGFVLNELISNALKYAFTNKETGILQISLRQNIDELLLKVKDNGDGFPSGLNVYKAQSFGYKLVKAFAQKLKARLEVYNDNGACVLLHIRKYNISSLA